MARNNNRREALMEYRKVRQAKPASNKGEAGRKAIDGKASAREAPSSPEGQTTSSPGKNDDRDTEDDDVQVDKSDGYRGNEQQKYYDWEGNELDVKIAKKSIMFEGKRYSGHKMNLAIDMITARGKRPSIKKRVDPYTLCLTDAEIAAAQKKATAAARNSAKGKLQRENAKKKAIEENRARESKNKGGLVNWMHASGS